MSIIKKVVISSNLICFIIQLFYKSIILILLIQILMISLLRLILSSKILLSILIYFNYSLLKKLDNLLYQRLKDYLRLYRVFRRLQTILELDFDLKDYKLY